MAYVKVVPEGAEAQVLIPENIKRWQQYEEWFSYYTSFSYT